MLCTLPEELIHQILSDVLVSEPPLATDPASASCKHAAPAPFSARAGRGKLSALLVSHQLCRIGLPLFWHTMHITSDGQCERLIADQPKAGMVRTLIVDALFAHLGEMLHTCASASASSASSGGVKSLDFSLTVPDNLPSDDEDVFNFQTDAVARFVSGVRALRASLKHLTIRKASTTYLTVPWVQDVFDGLGSERWPMLESAYIAFRMSDSATWPSSASAGRRSDFAPQHALLRGLAMHCPRLHTLTTHMPTVWSPLLLSFSSPPLSEPETPIISVPSDRKIVLLPGAAPSNSSNPSLGRSLGRPASPPLVAAQFPALSLYLRGASKHPELMRMFSLGASAASLAVPGARGRAHTWAGVRAANEHPEAEAGAVVRAK